MGKSLNISIVTETFPPDINGVAMTLSHLIAQMTSRGHHVQLVRPKQSDEHAVPPLASQTLLVKGLPIPGYRELTLGLPAGLTLRKQWQKHRPDIIYVATEGPLGWSAVKAAEKLGIPAVSGFHTQFHHYTRYYRAGWLQPLVYRYLTSLHKKTVCTLVPTEEMRLQMSDDIQPIQVLGRGIDTRLFTPTRRCEALRREWGVAPNETVFLYVGRLAREKNIELAINTFLQLKANVPSARLVLVGNGPDYVRLYSRQDGLIFVGTRTGEELARHYASSDIFLFPSQSETFGNVVLEAMASGLGVVAFDEAAAHIHIRHGKNGMLVQTRDEAAFTRHSASLLLNSAHLQSIRHQARLSMVEQSWEQVGFDFERILRNYSGKEEYNESGKCLAASLGSR